jgi:hypothetical protein
MKRWHWIVLGYFALAVGCYLANFRYIDWPTYRGAALLIIHGQNPYGIGMLAEVQNLYPIGYYNPPWMLWPIAPLAILPERIGGALWMAAGVFMFWLLAYQLSRSIYKSSAFILTLPVLYSLYSGQIDPLVLSGLIMPRPIGLLFLLAKPQIGAGIAVYWIWDTWRSNGLRAVLRMLAPVTIAYLISFIPFGFYLGAGQSMINEFWNWSVWPLAIPLGIWLIWWGIKRKREGLALSAAPCLSPYLGFYSWSTLVLGWVELGNWFYLLVPLSWVPVLIAHH